MGSRNHFDKSKMPTPEQKTAELKRLMTPDPKALRIQELETALASQIEITNVERGHAERCARKLEQVRLVVDAMDSEATDNTVEREWRSCCDQYGNALRRAIGNQS
jgi:hypothetical protein